MIKMTTYTRTDLEAMTRETLRKLCFRSYGLGGMSKETKDACINAILLKQLHEDVPVKKAEAVKPIQAVKVQEELKGIEFNAQSTLTKPNAKTGDKTTTTIHVSCGASSGAFPVAGKSVFQVGEFLREVLNVDSLSTGIVNGKTVEPSYTLREGDRLEFLKPAGRKG